MEMETECRKWNTISVGEYSSGSVEWKEVQSHVEWSLQGGMQQRSDRGQSQNECPLTNVP